MHPLINVIIAVYNGEKFIADAVETVLQQTWQNIHIIIINDGSTDNTHMVLQQLKHTYSLTVISQPNMGVSAALNAGLAAATAEYIAILDADDLWHKNKLEKQMQAMQQQGADICFTYLEEFETVQPGEASSKYGARPAPLKGYAKTTMLTHKSNFETYGLFHEGTAVGDFIEWYSRLLRDNKTILMLEEVLAYRRVHTTNTTRNVNKNAYLELLKRHLDEKRKLTQ